MISPFTSPGTLIYCQHCRDLVAVVAEVTVVSDNEDNFHETVKFKNPATDIEYLPGETERCPSCNQIWFYKSYFVQKKPTVPCSESITTERLHLMELIDFLTSQTQRQAKLLERILEYCQNTADTDSDIVDQVVVAITNHIEAEREHIALRMEALRKRTL